MNGWKVYPNAFPTIEGTSIPTSLAVLVYSRETRIEYGIEVDVGAVVSMSVILPSTVPYAYL